jgi:cell division septation protein DedD
VEDVAGIKQPPPVSEPDAVGESAPDAPVNSITTYRVQIASVKSEREAKEEWTRLKSKYPVLLRRLSLTVVRADLGAKGVFYRLLIGPLLDKAAAIEFCQSAKKRRIACLIHKTTK